MSIKGFGHVFSRNPLNRGEVERRSEEDLLTMANRESSLFLAIRDLNIPVNSNRKKSLHWMKRSHHLLDKEIKTAILLGIRGGVYHYAIKIKSGSDIDTFLTHQDQSVDFIDIRTCGQLLAPEDAGIAAQARIQLYWHDRMAFCSLCGSKTFMKRGGQVRQCSGCNTEHFPRTDPVIIVLVHDGEHCLLGQSKGRLQQTNMYSALAGFMDQGEAIEEAVYREVKEEAGIEVMNVKYHSSQPWPLPHSLMIGCHAEAKTKDIQFDKEEMTDVQWFPRNEILNALNGESDVLQIPMQLAIAHHLIKAWAKKEIPVL